MRLLPLSFLAAACLVGQATGQNCVDGDYGQLIASDPYVVVLPMQPIGFPFPLGGTTYSHMHISDNGNLQLSNAGVPAPLGMPMMFTPTTATFVAASPKVCALFANITGFGVGGRIFVKRTAALCTITWKSVRNYGSYSAISPRFDFQVTLYPSGEVHMVFGPGCTNISPVGGNIPAICGITPGGGAAVPPSSDLSLGVSTTDSTTYELWPVSGMFDLASTAIRFVPNQPGYTVQVLGQAANCSAVSSYGTSCSNLLLEALTWPTLGNGSFTMKTSNIQPVVMTAFVAWGTGVVNPGQPLDNIGMAGCSAYTNMDIGLFPTGPAWQVHTSSFAIPNVPSLAGLVCSTQALAFSTTNAAGLTVSNGLQLTLGFGH